jgi:hypothetical protein
MMRRKLISDDVKNIWYEHATSIMKDKYENGELFSEEHRKKLKENNYKRLNKGSDKLKLSDATKKKYRYHRKVEFLQKNIDKI